MEVRNRRRLQLLLIFAIFAASMIGAAVMMLSGWAPAAHSYGQPLKPERNIASVVVHTANGKPLTFASHSPAWTLVALPGPDCASQCLRKLDLVHRVQIGLGRDADKLRLVYLGTPPDGDAAAGFDKVWTLASTRSRPLEDLRASQPDSVSAVLVTPSGKAMLWYAAGFDPKQLQGDLKRAVKVVL